MHSRKPYCIAGSFIAQQKVLLHSKKVSPAAETGEKFLLRQKLEKSQSCCRNWRKVRSAAKTEDRHHVLPAVSVPLANETQFAHKPDQIELQLDRSQLPYSEYLGLVALEAAQPSTIMVPQEAAHFNHKKGPYKEKWIKLIIGCLDKLHVLLEA